MISEYSSTPTLTYAGVQKILWTQHGTKLPHKALTTGQFGEFTISYNGWYEACYNGWCATLLHAVAACVRRCVTQQAVLIPHVEMGGAPFCNITLAIAWFDTYHIMLSATDFYSVQWTIYHGCDSMFGVTPAYLFWHNRCHMIRLTWHMLRCEWCIAYHVRHVTQHNADCD